MANLQEITQYLQDSVDWIDAGLKHNFGDEEVVSDFIDSYRRVINATMNEFASKYQTLAHIIFTHFDGEFVMTEGEIFSEFSNYVFFIDTHKNDDGSVVISAHKEKV